MSLKVSKQATVVEEVLAGAFDQSLVSFHSLATDGADVLDFSCYPSVQVELGENM